MISGLLLSAAIALLILLLLTVFQIALIAGAPLGKFAWGGQHCVLPRSLRISSIASIVLYAIFAAFIVSKVGIIEVIPHEAVVSTGMWIISVYFCVGIVMNLMSRSRSERLLMTPLALSLAATFLTVTLLS